MSEQLYYALQIAKRIAHERPGVVGVGVGAKIKGEEVAKRAMSIIFYVAHKTDEVPRWEALPSYIEVGTPERPRRIRTDVIEADAKVAVQAWTEDEVGGVYTWPMPGAGGRRSLISNHVLGTDGVASFRGFSVRVINRAVALDAAQVSHDLLANNPWTQMQQHSVKPLARDPRSSDRTGRVFLPTRGRWKSVKIYDVDSTPPGFGSGFILTDKVTQDGDSGSLLVGEDDRPIGFLLGTWAGRSVFSGLQRAIRALL